MALVKGLHHVTAISGAPQRNLDFYRGLLGLRFIKKTVNFDDPSVYHLYYGDEVGTPGSALTFFPWEHMARGRRGRGETSETAFAVPGGSLAFWEERLRHAVVPIRREERFGERRLAFDDPDGMGLALVEPADADTRVGWTGDGVGTDHAIKGFYGVTLRLEHAGPTATVLTELLDYGAPVAEGGIYRYTAPAGSNARVVDVVVDTEAPAAVLGLGSVHHVAFRVADDTAHAAVRARIAKAGFNVTPVIDRDYFRAIYFRSPGGVLFEVSTDEPGFTIDEPKESLGQSLRLPRQHEHLRERLERMLPRLV